MIYINIVLVALYGNNSLKNVIPLLVCSFLKNGYI